VYPSDEYKLNAHSIEAKQSPAWQTIVTAPFDRDIEVAVLNERGYEVFALFVRRTQAGWLANRIDDFLAIAPTHWREPTGKN